MDKEWIRYRHLLRRTENLEIPILVGEITEDKRQIKVWCPYCGKYHFHGCGTRDGGPDLGEGHRVAHCPPKSPFYKSGYFIIHKSHLRDDIDIKKLWMCK
jgi:hypothetical protein